MTLYHPRRRLRRGVSVGYLLARGLIATVALGIGFIGALVALPWQSCVVVLLVVGLLAGSCVLAVADDPNSSLRQGRPLRAGMVAGLTAVSALGAFALFGVLGGLLVLQVHLLSPRSWTAMSRLRERARRLNSVTAVSPHEEASPSGGQAPNAPSIVVADRLTEADLCLAWASSFQALSKVASVAAYVTVAEARQACLDELERRDPESFRRWLESGARAASDPSKFVAPHVVENQRPGNPSI